MSHSHNHSHDMHHAHNHVHDVKNIKTAFFLNFGFTILELVGGILTNSMAILSDAIHDFGDSLSLALAWYFQKISTKKGDKNYSYGYKRFSLLGAFINSIVLVVGSVFVLYESIPRLMHPEQPKVEGMLLLAVIGIAVNGAAVFRLKKGDSLNEKVVSLHLLEDVLGWVAVLVGSILMYFVDLPIIDPILSLGISIYILFNVYRNIKQSLRIILQGVPDEINTECIVVKLKEIPEVKDIHDLHVWSADGNYNVLTAHVVTDRDYSLDELYALKTKIRLLLTENEIQHATVEFETANEQCTMEKCC